MRFCAVYVYCVLYCVCAQESEEEIEKKFEEQKVNVVKVADLEELLKWDPSVSVSAAHRACLMFDIVFAIVYDHCSLVVAAEYK